jgi:hypothetical protein
MEKKIVAIYKIPNDRNWLFNKNTDKMNEKLEYKELNYYDKINIKEKDKRNLFMDHDIFFLTFKKVKERLNKTLKISLDYIYIDKSSEIKKINYSDGITVYILNNPCQLLKFIGTDILFLRGNGPCVKKIGEFFCKSKKKTILLWYPACTLAFSYKNNKFLRKNYKKNIHSYFNNYNLNFYGMVDVLLNHNDKWENIVKKKNNKVNIINYFKPCSSIFQYDKSQNKVYDFIFVGDGGQVTKNHKLFIDFLNKCENKNININVAYVSRIDFLQSLPNFKENYMNININFFNNLAPDELSKLFNKSKINLTFSGRDYFPRTIVESLMCGCFNVILDTLFNGIEYINDNMGKIITSPSSFIENTKEKSLTYIIDEELFNKIVLTKNLNINHEKVYKESLKLFSLVNKKSIANKKIDDLCNAIKENIL